MKNLVKNLIPLYLVLCLCFLVVGCSTGDVNPDRDKLGLSMVKPATERACLDDIPEAKYMVRAKNEQGQEEMMEFVWPWYAAIGGKIANETGVFERAAAGQIDQSTILGLGTRKYFLWSSYRAKAVRVALRDPFDWNEIRKVLIEVGGEGNLLTKLTPLSQEVIEQQVWGKNIPPEFFITGALTEVTVGEASSAAGITFAGIGISGKVVQTSVAGSLEITDPYTGELLVSVMSQNRVTACQVGAEGFRIISSGGLEEFLNVEYTVAKEIIKQQVQVELVDFLVYKAFKDLYESRPRYLVERLHYRVGRIQAYAEHLAAQKGLTVVGQVTPVGGVISGLVSSDETPLEGVLVSANNGGSSDTTSAEGEYKVLVQYGWSGEVMATKDGYAFETVDKAYDSVITALINRDYTARLLTYSISGTVSSDEIPLEGVLVSADNVGVSATTNAQGEYELLVDHGWSGTVTLTKEGYIFETAGTEYDNVTAEQTNRDYAATLLTYTISGTVSSDETPLEGVFVSAAGNGGSSATTNAEGEYELLVDYDWNGTVTLTKEGYIFETAGTEYDNVTAEQTNRDYAATLLTYTIAGTVTYDEIPLEGVLVSADNGGGSAITNTEGEYEVLVQSGWSGTLTLTKDGYTFEPADDSTYDNVTANQTNRDYAAEEAFTISGKVISGGTPIEGVLVSTNNGGGSCTTSAQGEYELLVYYGWSGTVTPTKESYRFSPTSMGYDNVSSNFAMWTDFSAEEI